MSKPAATKVTKAIEEQYNKLSYTENQFKLWQKFSIVADEAKSGAHNVRTLPAPKTFVYLP